MVVTSPLDEIKDMLADDSDPEYRRSVTQEEEFCSNPFDGEGTRPAESTGNFTRKEKPFDCEGTRPRVHQQLHPKSGSIPAND